MKTLTLKTVLAVVVLNAFICTSVFAAAAKAPAPAKAAPAKAAPAPVKVVAAIVKAVIDPVKVAAEKAAAEKAAAAKIAAEKLAAEKAAAAKAAAEAAAKKAAIEKAAAEQAAAQKLAATKAAAQKLAAEKVAAEKAAAVKHGPWHMGPMMMGKPGPGQIVRPPAPAPTPVPVTPPTFTLTDAMKKRIRYDVAWRTGLALSDITVTGIGGADVQAKAKNYTFTYTYISSGSWSVPNAWSFIRYEAEAIVNRDSTNQMLWESLFTQGGYTYQQAITSIFNNEYGLDINRQAYAEKRGELVNSLDANKKFIIRCYNAAHLAYTDAVVTAEAQALSDKVANTRIGGVAIGQWTTYNAAQFGFDVLLKERQNALNVYLARMDLAYFQANYDMTDWATPKEGDFELKSFKIGGNEVFAGLKAEYLAKGYEGLYEWSVVPDLTFTFGHYENDMQGNRQTDLAKVTLYQSGGKKEAHEETIVYIPDSPYVNYITAEWDKYDSAGRRSEKGDEITYYDYDAQFKDIIGIQHESTVKYYPDLPGSTSHDLYELYNWDSNGVLTGALITYDGETQVVYGSPVPIHVDRELEATVKVTAPKVQIKDPNEIVQIGDAKETLQRMALRARMEAQDKGACFTGEMAGKQGMMQQGKEQ